MCLLWSYYSSTCFGTGMWNLSHIEQANPKPGLFSINTQTCWPLWSELFFSLFYFETPKLCVMGTHGFYICLLVRSAGRIVSNRPALRPVGCLANTFLRYKNTIERTSLSPFHVLSPSQLLLPSLSFPSFHLIKAHGLSPLFTKYSLTKKKWEFLLIEDQSGKVSSSNPALSIRAP